MNKKSGRQGHEENLGVMDMIIILIVMMTSWNMYVSKLIKL